MKFSAFALPSSCSPPPPMHKPPPGKSCTVDASPASPAEIALLDRNELEAERLFRAMPPTTRATAGNIRALLAQGKSADALQLAQAEAAAHPNDAVLQDALGDVRFRRGEVMDAAAAFNRAVQRRF